MASDDRGRTNRREVGLANAVVCSGDFRDCGSGGNGRAVYHQGINGALREAVSSLAESASHLAGAAGQVSSSSQSLARSSSDQAASIEETSATAEEINAMAVRNGESSRSAAELVMSSQERFVNAKRVLDETVTAMAGINSSSDKISKINKVIDEIAFQTNILAPMRRWRRRARVRRAWDLPS